MTKLRLLIKSKRNFVCLLKANYVCLLKANVILSYFWTINVESQESQLYHAFQYTITKQLFSVVLDYCLLGMKDGRIPDRDITASSYHVSDNGLTPAKGRLDQTVSSWSSATSKLKCRMNVLTKIWHCSAV